MSKKTADGCMFCGAVPCECDGPAKPKRTGKRLPSVTPSPASMTTVELPADDVKPATSSRLARMKAKAAADAKRQPAPAPSTPVQNPVDKHESTKKDRIKARITAALDEDQVVMNGAIRALRDLLGPDDLKKYAEILNSEPSLEEEKMLWKARHRDRQTAARS